MILSDMGMISYYHNMMSDFFEGGRPGKRARHG